MADLTTLANVRRYLRGEFLDEANTKFDAELTRLIGSASADARLRTGRALDVPAASRTERRDGNGRDRMLLNEWPATAVTSVTVDGVVVPAQTTPTGNGWYADALDGPTAIQLVGYTFTAGRGNVSIVYTAGWATVPADLEQAVIQLVALAFVDGDHVGFSSKSVNGDTATWDGGPQLVNAGAILDRYARISVG